MGQVIQRLEEIKKQKNLISFVDAFESVLNKFGYIESLKEFFADSLGERIAQSIEVVLRELRYFAEFSGSQKITSDDAGFFLKQLLKGIRGSLDQGNGVRIVPFELAAGLEPKVLFCGGAVEGDLPSKPPIDPILPEQVKKAVGLPDLEYYLNRQKRYFRRLLNISRDDPFFSYPEADGDKIFLPSPFLDWGMRLLPPVYNISTEEEILLRQGEREQRDFSTVMWSGDFFLTKNMREMLLQCVNQKTYFRITDIDAYRQCPLRYYIEKFLCLEKEEAPRFEIEARLWGRVAHTAMEFLYRDGDIPIDAIDRRLFLGLEQGLDEFSLGDFWAVVARRIFQKLLTALKMQETDLRVQGFSPFLVEKGMKVVVNGLGLKGKVDRVDKREIKTEDRRKKAENEQP
ncbi:MAG: PD-(D/E)XK nuclease family protein, partial [Nitrospiraceae bacterium]